MPKERYKLNVTLNTPTREYYVTFEADSIDEAVSVLLANEPSCTSMVIVFSVPRQIVVDLDQVSDEAQQYIYNEGLRVRDELPDLAWDIQRPYNKQED